MLKPIIAIAIGSSVGGILRWTLSTKFNSWYAIPFGTLLSNLIAGYLIGLMVSFFSYSSDLSPEWRLLIVTGFCGGLSTFSTFSIEIVEFIQKGQIGLGITTILIHVAGSIIMTILGVLSYQWLKGF